MAQDNIFGSAVVKATKGGILFNLPLQTAGVGELFIQTKDLDFGTTKEKYIDHLVMDIEADGSVPSLAVEVGYRDNRKDALTWLAKQTMTLDNPIVNLRAQARYFVLKITDELPVVQWKLSEIEAFGEVVGMGRLG